MFTCKIKVLWGIIIGTAACYGMDLKKYALTKTEKQNLVQFDITKTEQGTYAVNGSFIASFVLYKNDGQSICKLSIEPEYFQTLPQQSPKIQSIVKELYRIKIHEILNTNTDNKQSYNQGLIWSSFWYRFQYFAPNANQFQFLVSDDFEFSSLGVCTQQLT